jgi:hypothetical protein
MCYETVNRNAVFSPAICLKASAYLAWSFKCLAFRSWYLASCLHVFFSIVNSFARIGWTERKLAQKHVLSEIFLAFLQCTCRIGRFSRHFLATVGIRKSLANGRLKVVAPVEKNPRKWFQRRKWANEEREKKKRWIRRNAIEERKCIWRRQIWCRRLYALQSKFCLPFIFLPPAFYISHRTSFLTDVFCKLASFCCYDVRKNKDYTLLHIHNKSSL